MKTIQYLFKMKQFIQSLFFVSLVLFVFACKQESEEPEPTSEAITEEESANNESILDGAISDGMIDDLSTQAEALIESVANGQLKNGQDDSCREVTFNPFTSTITVDFGEGCTGQYGLTRQGQIVIKYTGFPGASPVAWTLTTENFALNNTQLQGQITGSGLQEQEGGIFKYDMTYDVVVTFADQKTLSDQGAFTVEWLEGFGDEDRSNDVLRFTGANTGVNRRGQNYGVTIVEPIIRQSSCLENAQFLAVSGVEEYQVGIFGKYSVNYGDGTCDRSIEITTPRRTFPINLP